jgi:hypothetical protein
MMSSKVMSDFWFAECEVLQSQSRAAIGSRIGKGRVAFASK